MSVAPRIVFVVGTGHLGALFHDHDGVSLADRDFGRFPQLRTRSPLLG